MNRITPPISKTVLVTGGAGYIGSHACKVLARAGYLPIAFDNLCAGHKSAVLWGPLYEGDVNDRHGLLKAFEIYRPEAVFHFAAHAYVGESVSDPAKYYRNNFSGSLTLLEAMNDFDIKKLIFSSTCATYGSPTYLPIDESHPKNPINPYGASKLMTERMLADFEIAHDLKWVALRYFNAAGADENCDVGENHAIETHLIPLLFDSATGKIGHINIFGSDYETRDGTCVRDYVHVTDLADAHLKSLIYLEQGGVSDVFNLGVSHGFSVLEVILEAEKIIGKKIPYKFVSRRAGDPAALIGDGSKANAILGWRPAHSSLRNILETAWKWYCKNT